MADTTLSSGTRKTIKLGKISINVKEIKFNWGAGSNAIKLRNHVVNDDVKAPEWEYNKTKRFLRRKSPMLKGDDVKKVQQILISHGIDVGPDKDDGKFGEKTEKAVKEFQKKHFLSYDGKVGRETRTFLGIQGAAAYKKNTQFNIQVKFSASSWINSAEIWADDSRYGFGGLGSESDPSKPVTVNFSGGESGYYKFKVKTPPTKISLYKTKWLWKCKNVNGGGPKVKNIGRTEHLIYIVSDTPEIVPTQKLLLGNTAFNSTHSCYEVYQPTKNKGTLSIELKSGLLELYYQNWSSKLEGPFLSGKIDYSVSQNKHGVYLIRVMGTANIKIRSGFFQEGQTSEVPWNGWYWPFVDGDVVGGSRSYCEPNMYDNGGPLELYDTYSNQSGSSSSKVWELNNYRISDPSADPSGGHCDGTAMAGFEMNEPNSAKTLNNIHFSIENLKGLATERCWIPRGSENAPNGDSSNEFRMGGTYLNSKWFHEKLLERLHSGSNKGFILKKRFASGSPIGGLWNWPVYRFRADFVAEGVNDPDYKKIKIKCVLTYRKLKNLRSKKWEHDDYTYNCRYRLELDDNGSISTGSWDPTAGNKPLSIYYKKINVNSINPNVDRNKIDQILQSP